MKNKKLYVVGSELHAPDGDGFESFHRNQRLVVGKFDFAGMPHISRNGL